MKQTTVVDSRGETLATFPDLMTQVREGRDFYLGQKRYVVRDIECNGIGTLMTIKLSDPDERCPYPSHHQPCDCRGEAGDR